MKSKTNRRVKRVKKTLRTRRKLRKMKGGVIEWFQKRKNERQVAYCRECLTTCNGVTQTQPQPPPSQTQPNENGWYATSDGSFRNGGYGGFTLLKNESLTNKDNSINTSGIEYSKYSTLINKLPNPSKEYKSNGKKYNIFCDNFNLHWKNIDTSEEYSFNITNPLQITIDGKNETLSLPWFGM